MKLSIQHSNTKRTIDGAFNICGSREDIKFLRDQLQDKINDASWSFGWVNIVPRALKPQANTAPIHWDAAL